MNREERDRDQLYVIVHYCDRLEKALDHFGPTYAVFEANTVFQDSCSLCIIQIGEAVHRLSSEFTQAHPEIEWNRIYGMRCRLVHGYDMFDADIVWDAIERCIPPLRAFCEQRIGKAARE